MAWNDLGTFSAGSSVFSGDLASTTSTARLNNPSLLLFQRMNDLSTRLLLSQTTGKHIVALNRRLDELEEIISIDGLAQDEDRAPADEGHGLSGIAERLEQRKKYSEQSPLALHPSESEAESTRLPEVIDETSQLLLRVGEAMKQLQRRQEEIKVPFADCISRMQLNTEV